MKILYEANDGDQCIINFDNVAFIKQYDENWVQVTFVNGEKVMLSGKVKKLFDYMNKYHCGSYIHE